MLRYYHAPPSLFLFHVAARNGTGGIARPVTLVLALYSPVSPTRSQCGSLVCFDKVLAAQGDFVSPESIVVGDRGMVPGGLHARLPCRGREKGGEEWG